MPTQISNFSDERTVNVTDAGGQNGLVVLSVPAQLTIRQAFSSGQLLYLGEASPGSSETDTVWRIRKFTYDSDGLLTDVKFPTGSGSFLFEWADRASLVYS